MKSKIAVILLAVFLCLTTGCNNASHIAQTPDPISSSDSNIVPSESETAQAEKKTEVDRPQSTESQTDSRAAEFPASVSESDTQPTPVPDQADHSKLILADEPTGALDSHSSQMLLSTIQSINEDLGATILMVTHDAFSASYANRILFLRDGAIFTEIRKGGDSRRTFFEKILDVLTMMGGGMNDVR